MKEGDKIFTGIQQGDPEAWSQLYDQQFNRLSNLARRVGVSDLWAEDVAQDAMLKLFLKSATVDMEQNPQGYLNRTLTNAAIDHRRRERARPTLPLLDRDVYPAPTEEMEMVEAEHDLEQQLAQVTAPGVELLRDRADGYDVREVSQRHGIPESTVKTQIFRVRQQLKRIA